MSGLKDIYEFEVYKPGKESFHTFDLEDVYQNVYKVFAGNEVGRSVLDLGCGDGHFCKNYLNNSGHVLGIDYSIEGVTKAQKERPLNMYFSHFSFEHYLANLDNSDIGQVLYDIVVSIGVIEHLDDPATIFKIAQKTLKKGGELIIECPNFYNIRGVIWKALEIFIDAEMSRTDKHTILPTQMIEWAESFGFKLKKIKTFRHNQGSGEKLFEDYDRRLRLALSHSNKDKQVDEFLDFLKPLLKGKIFPNTSVNGAEIIYKFQLEEK